MRIAVGDVDALMPHAVCDGQRGESLVDQQRDMAMSEVVNSNALHAGCLAAPAHFAVQLVLTDGEDTGVAFRAMQPLDVILDLVAQEGWHLHHADAFLGFGRGDDILPVNPLIGLGDAYRTALKIEVSRSQRQHLAQTQAAPVQDFKGVIGNGLVHDGFDELVVLGLRPEKHFLLFFGAHVASLLRRVYAQSVKADGVVEQAAELVVQRLQVGLGEGLALIILHGAHLVLPVDYILGRDLGKLLLSEIRQDLLLDDALLGLPGVQLDPGLDILFVQLREALEGHIDVGLLLHQEFPFPGLGFTLGCEAALHFLLALTLSVGIAELHKPGAVFFVLEYTHGYSSLFGSFRVP